MEKGVQVEKLFGVQRNCSDAEVQCELSGAENMLKLCAISTKPRNISPSDKIIIAKHVPFSSCNQTLALASCSQDSPENGICSINSGLVSKEMIVSNSNKEILSECGKCDNSIETRSKAKRKQNKTRAVLKRGSKKK